MLKGFTMSFASEMLEKVEAMLIGKADKDVQSYTHNGRSLNKFTIAELMTLRDQLKSEIKKEKLEKELASRGVKRIKGVRYV